MASRGGARSGTLSAMTPRTKKFTPWGVMALVAAGALGACHRADPRIQRSLQDDFEHDPSLAAMLCAFPVRSFGDVSVTQVQYEEANQSGTGRAVISGTAVPFRGTGAGIHCGGTVTFDYALPAAHARGMNNARYYNANTEHVTVTNFVVVRRDATGP